MRRKGLERFDSSAGMIRGTTTWVVLQRELSLTKQSREGGEYTRDEVLRMSADGVRAAGELAHDAVMWCKLVKCLHGDSAEEFLLLSFVCVVEGRW